LTDLRKLQKEVYQNKVDKGFNVTDLPLEFCLLSEEVSEAFRAHFRKLPDFGSELADILIYLLGIAEISGIDLEKELLKKMEINKEREYRMENGVHIKER